MRWLWGVGFFAVCVAVGAYRYYQSAAKVKFYTDLIAFCNNLHTEIGFALTPLAQIIAQYQNAYTAEFNQVLTGYGQLLHAKADITREQCLALTRDPQVAEFFYNLGRTGSQGEKDKIQTAIGVFTARQQQAEADLRGKASIIFKLLIIIGIAGVILWI